MSRQTIPAPCRQLSFIAEPPYCCVLAKCDGHTLADQSGLRYILADRSPAREDYMFFLIRRSVIKPSLWVVMDIYFGPTPLENALQPPAGDEF